MDKSLYRKAYRKINKEKLSEYNRLWRVRKLLEDPLFEKKKYNINRDRINKNRKIWFEKNKIIIGKKRRAWYHRKKEMQRKRLDFWVKENRNKVRSYARKYANSARGRDRGKVWRLNNKEKISCRNARRRSLESSCGFFTKEDVSKIRKSQSGLCFYCKSVLISSTETVDHKVALVRGGSNYPENICLACKKCNSSKGSKTVEEFLSTGVFNGSSSSKSPSFTE